MVTNLVVFSVVPLVALLGSAGYAAVATYELADWRPALFTALLVLMSVHQANEVRVYLDNGVAAASRGFGEYPETAVNLLAGVAVVYVLRLVREERRLSEQATERLAEIGRLQRRNDRLEEFASVVSHDLRNPLNTVRGYVELAREEVEIRVGKLDGGGFYVADDGPGIEPAQRSDVFELGYTTDSAGTGFGLAIVERIAAAHGWSVTVTESADGGARFEFRPGENPDTKAGSSDSGDSDSGTEAAA